MMHAFVDVGDKTMCSRCGNEVKRVDEVCPAVTDGTMYAKRDPLVQAYMDRDGLSEGDAADLVAATRAMLAG